MLTRILSALVGIPIVVLLVFWPGGVPFAFLVGSAAVIGLLELYRAARAGGARPHVFLGLAAAVGSLYFGRGGGSDLSYLVGALTGLILVASTAELMREPKAPYVNIGTTVLGTVYIAWLLLHFIWLRSMGAGQFGPWHREMGVWLVMFVLLTTWAMDTGAYFTGRCCGRTKLVPKISPGKTAEGAVGGFAAAIIVGAVMGAVLHMPQPHGLILGGIIGIAGQIGDLTASSFKREVGIKDFGAVMPGHGGILDRIDSLLFTGPAVYWYLTLFLSGWLRP